MFQTTKQINITQGTEIAGATGAGAAGASGAKSDRAGPRNISLASKKWYVNGKTWQNHRKCSMKGMNGYNSVPTFHSSPWPRGKPFFKQNQILDAVVGASPAFRGSYKSRLGIHIGGR